MKYKTICNGVTCSTVVKINYTNYVLYVSSLETSKNRKPHFHVIIDDNIHRKEVMIRLYKPDYLYYHNMKNGKMEYSEMLTTDEREDICTILKDTWKWLCEKYEELNPASKAYTQFIKGKDVSHHKIPMYEFHLFCSDETTKEDVTNITPKEREKMMEDLLYQFSPNIIH